MGLPLSYFNSIKVQLRQVGDPTEKPGLIFQFHKGTIKTEFNDNPINAFCYFNSIKVQLRHR